MVWWRVVYKSRYHGGYEILDCRADTAFEVILTNFRDDFDRIISITKVSDE